MIYVYTRRSHVSSRLSFELLIIFHVGFFVCKVVVGLLTVFEVQQIDSRLCLLHFLDIPFLSVLLR